MRKAGKVSQNDLRVLEQFYTKGSAAYGSIDNLQKATKLPRKKIENFLHTRNAHTKYRQVRRNFPRLKVIAYDINEIWSIDVAYVDKLAKYNNGVKYLLVAVDVLSRYLRVSPMRSKSAEETARTFRKMIQKQKPQKVWNKVQSLLGYKQNFTDEIFTIRRIATFNPPTYNLTDADGETIQGKFYEPELTKTNGRV